MSRSLRTCAPPLMNTERREEELSSRMRLRFGLQQCLPSNFSPRPLYTCTPTLKVSFNQRGTLAFAACLSNLTSKGLGHLSLSLSLSLSLISPCAHAHEITLFQRARVYHAPEGSRLRSETQLRSREAGAYVIFQQTRKKRSSSEDRCLRSKLLSKCFRCHQ